MALIQAIVNLISRSVGKILSALFGWAVVALFGRVSGRRRMLLSGLVASAAAWPLLLAGVVAPRAATFFLTFVPLPDALPGWLVRFVWIALALFVPIAVGAGLRSPPTEKGGTRAGLFGSVLRGFPITAGLALAFLVLLVTVPVLRVVSALRGHQDIHVPLVTTAESYPAAGALVAETLRRHDISVWALRSRLEAISAEMSERPLPFDEWQVVYRQVLQLDRALAGRPQPLEARRLGKDTVMATSMAPTPATTAPADSPRALSTVALMRRILGLGSLLIHKEVELARAELDEDLHAAVGMVKLLGPAALLAVLGLDLILMAAVLALAAWLPAWAVALALGGLLLAVAAVLGAVAWSRRVQAPLDLTRKTVKEDLQLAKERLA